MKRKPQSDGDAIRSSIPQLEHWAKSAITTGDKRQQAALLLLLDCIADMPGIDPLVAAAIRSAHGAAFGASDDLMSEGYRHVIKPWEKELALPKGGDA